MSTAEVPDTSIALHRTILKRNVERHFQTVHKKYDTDFPLKSELRKRKVRELKSQLIGQQQGLEWRDNKKGLR